MSDDSQIAENAALSASVSAETAAAAAERAYKSMLRSEEIFASMSGAGRDGAFRVIKMSVLQGGADGEYCYVGIRKKNGVFVLSTFTKEEIES